MCEAARPHHDPQCSGLCTSSLTSITAPAIMLKVLGCNRDHHSCERCRHDGWAQHLLLQMLLLQMLLLQMLLRQTFLSGNHTQCAVAGCASYKVSVHKHHINEKWKRNRGLGAQAIKAGHATPTGGENRLNSNPIRTLCDAAKEHLEVSRGGQPAADPDETLLSVQFKLCRLEKSGGVREKCECPPDTEDRSAIAYRLHAVLTRLTRGGLIKPALPLLRIGPILGLPYAYAGYSSTAQLS